MPPPPPSPSKQAAAVPLPELMRQAVTLATENVTSGRGGPFGAVIARGSEIVANGVNLVTAINDPTAHAEITAIRRAASSLNTFMLTGLHLYTSCEPCPMCLAASFWARLDAVFFAATSVDAARAGFDDSRLYHEINSPIADRWLPMQQVLAEEAWTPFAAWQRTAAKIDY